MGDFTSPPPIPLWPVGFSTGQIEIPILQRERLRRWDFSYQRNNNSFISLAPDPGELPDSAECPQKGSWEPD